MRRCKESFLSSNSIINCSLRLASSDSCAVILWSAIIFFNKCFHLSCGASEDRSMACSKVHCKQSRTSRDKRSACAMAKAAEALVQSQWCFSLSKPLTQSLLCVSIRLHVSRVCKAPQTVEIVGTHICCVFMMPAHIENYCSLRVGQHTMSVWQDWPWKALSNAWVIVASGSMYLELWLWFSWSPTRSLHSSYEILADEANNHTSQFINACSAEKAIKNVPSVGSVELVSL